MKTIRNRRGVGVLPAIIWFAVIPLLLAGIYFGGGYVIDLRAYAHELEAKSAALEQRVAELENNLEKCKAEEASTWDKFVVEKDNSTKWINSKTSVKINPNRLEKIVDAIWETEKPLLIMSIIEDRSKFQEDAIESNPDPSWATMKLYGHGLGQIVPRWWSEDLKDAGIISNDSDLLDGVTNVKAMDHIIKKLSDDGKKSDEEVMQLYVGKKAEFPKKIQTNFQELKDLIGDKI